MVEVGRGRHPEPTVSKDRLVACFDGSVIALVCYAVMLPLMKGSGVVCDRLGIAHVRLFEYRWLK